MAEIWLEYGQYKSEIYLRHACIDLVRLEYWNKQKIGLEADGDSLSEWVIEWVSECVSEWITKKLL